MVLGTRIKKYLDENGIKYSFVANELGLPVNVFSVMINGKRKISADEYVDICRVLRLSADYFAEKVNGCASAEGIGTASTG